MTATRNTEELNTNETPNKGIALAWRFALRELRGGIKGFYIFLACIALGVGAISGVNSVAKSITGTISNEGQALLGGDIAFSVLQRDLAQDELAFLKSNGAISKIAATKAMARLGDGSDQTLIELKAADSAYPLYGQLRAKLGQLEISDLGPNEAFVAPLLLERLNIKLGDEIHIGESRFTIKQTISNEPDQISEGMALGPKVIISHQGMATTQLIKPGSLIRYTYRLKNPALGERELKALIKQANTDFPDTGWRIRSRNNAAPALARSIARFSQFLTLVGLTSLIVGGVGIANAIRAFLEAKRPVIATFKSLGASGRFVFQVYLIQIMLLACLGIFAGLIIGLFAPFGAAWALADLVPISNETLFFPEALALGALFGFLTALTFAIGPLANANNIPAAALFRATNATQSKLPSPFYLFLLILCVGALVALAVLNTENQYVALVFVGAIAFSFVLLQIVSFAIQASARIAPKFNVMELRMAVANIHRPGSLTPSVVMSLGLGLALLVALTQIDGNLRRQVNGDILDKAPDFFFADIQNHEIDDFQSALNKIVPEGIIVSVPMLRGRITHLKGTASQDYDAKEGAWVLRGDRGITYADTLPENSTLQKGEWWDADYSGKPLVSFSAEEAHELGLDVGDMLRVNVLGRSFDARISSLRNVEWQSMGINFVLVFSPNTFAGAPHSWLATLNAGNGENAPSDGEILRAVTRSYPTVTSVRVSEALASVNNIIKQLSTAIRAAALVALVSSVLVLAGALAAGNKARIHDSVVLKTLGATRWVLIRSFIYEYAILGIATALFALAAGGIAAWFVIAKIMHFPAHFIPSIALYTLLAALVFTVGFGLIGTWRILGQKAAPVLREL